MYVCHPISLGNPLLAYEISQTPGVVNQTIISFHRLAAKRYTANRANLSPTILVTRVFGTDSITLAFSSRFPDLFPRREISFFEVSQRDDSDDVFSILRIVQA